METMVKTITITIINSIIIVITITTRTVTTIIVRSVTAHTAIRKVIKSLNAGRKSGMKTRIRMTK
jgi:hypothetical protein